MEPITIFALSVGSISVCRLTFAAADFFGKGIYSKGSNPARRDCWYCFFKTSDLLGPKKERQPVTSESNLERRRRLQQRPRLQAEVNLH